MNGPGPLAGRQAELVAALVAGGPTPAGFDGDRLAATRAALLRKRAAAAAAAWPRLAGSLGAAWAPTWPGSGPVRSRSAGCATSGTWPVRLRARGELSPAAAAELADREAELHYDGHRAPRARRGAGLRRLARRLGFPTGT